MKSTLAHHIFVSLAAACFAYLLVLMPATTLGPGKTIGYAALTTVIWFFALPLVLFLNGSAEKGFGGDFAAIKLASAAVGMLVIQGLLAARYLKGAITDNVLTGILGLLLAVNIAEAIYTQFKSYLDEKKGTDLANAVIGLGLLAALALSLWHRKMQVDTGRGQLRLKSNLGWWWILAYSFWNMLFRSHYAENTAWLIFFFVSIAMPIAVAYAGWGDWLQARAAALVVLLVVSLGVGDDEFNIFTDYDKEGVPSADPESPISKMQLSDVYIYGCLALGSVTLLASFVEALKLK